MAGTAYPPPGRLGNPAVLRSPGRCFLLLLVSGGLWAVRVDLPHDQGSLDVTSRPAYQVREPARPCS